jgi:hypothetical protein
VLVAREAGSANALIPVIDELRGEGLGICAIGLEQAAKMFREAAIEHVAVAGMASALAVLERLSPRPNFVLSGTSLKADDDALLWAWAQRRHLPLLAFVDHWINPWVRFSSLATAAAPRYGLLPEKVAVINSEVKQEMVVGGCDAARILVTGHPQLQRLARQPPPPNPILRATLLNGGQRLIVFFSEPYSHFQPRWRLNGGPAYNELTVLSMLLDALRMFAAQHGLACRLAVKPHPREDSHELSRLLRASADDLLQGRIIEMQRHDLAMAADLVVGMRSMALLEAQVIGCRTLSVQADSPERMMPIGDVPVVRDRPGLDEYLAGSLRHSLWPARDASPPMPCPKQGLSVADYVKGRVCPG